MAAILDWYLAMEQVGGDKDFLIEVIGDLLKEADEAEAAINTAINTKDIIKVQKEAHKIKGSASYLHCQKLHDISYTLQQSGTARPPDQVISDMEWIEIKNNFEIYKVALIELKTEVSQNLA